MIFSEFEMQNKTVKLLSISLSLFAGCLAFGYGVLGGIKDNDKHHWLFILPMILPILGIFLSVKALIIAKGWQWKCLALLAAVANIGLAVFVFFAYSLTYLQF